MQKRLLDCYDFSADGRLTLINIVSHPKAVWILDGEIPFSRKTITSLKVDHQPTEQALSMDGVVGSRIL